jgi:D-glycero-alpha-D-manno-heptose-7-phosphate kinase
MIVVRTPFRISFAGGGSDLPVYYRRFGGVVLSTTIDRYMYIVIHPYFHSKIRLKYSRMEDVERVEDIQHPIVRECLRRYSELPKGMEIASFADVPAGTGLGSSSAFTVGLLHALVAHHGQFTSASELASEACEIEINRLGEPIGKQDQYAVAYGGLNYIRFHQDESVEVEPLVIPPSVKRTFENNLLLFFLGHERSAASILAGQSANMEDPSKAARVTAMVEIADAFRCALQDGRLDECGTLLDESWKLKRALADGVSTDEVDAVYARALEAGASGGKLLGAGGGGFLLLYCRPGRQAALRQSLYEYRELPVKFSERGSEVLVSENEVRE